jgi:hypothetical protein
MYVFRVNNILILFTTSATCHVCVQCSDYFRANIWRRNLYLWLICEPARPLLGPRLERRVPACAWPVLADLGVGVLRLRRPRGRPYQLLGQRQGRRLDQER